MTQPLRPHPSLSEYHATEPDRLDYLKFLFDRTAEYYDRANWLFSSGTGQWYRRRALRRAVFLRGMRLLDVAVWQRDWLLPPHTASRVAKADIIGLDPSERMLHEARRKLAVPLIMGQAEALPLADSSVDFVSLGYALRHVSNLSTAFAEFHRVLRPGGRLLNSWRSAGLMGASPTHSPRPTWGGWCLSSRWLKPKSELAALMRYHWDTIEHCVSPETILAQLSKSGFSEIICETESAPVPGLSFAQAYRLSLLGVPGVMELLLSPRFCS